MNCGTVNLNFTSYATIREGSTGSPVAAAQCLLEAQGFELGTPSSSFGPSTTAAVRSYQQPKALPVNGRITRGRED